MLESQRTGTGLLSLLQKHGRARLSGCPSILPSSCLLLRHSLASTFDEAAANVDSLARTTAG